MLIAERPLRKALDRLGGRGRSGTKRLARLIDEGEFGLPVPESPFERRFLHFLDAHALRQPERQHEIEDATGGLVARVDFAYPDLMIAIECDGKKHHFGTNDWERDLERRSRLAALGWRVIHISWDMLVNRSGDVPAPLAGNTRPANSLVDQLRAESSAQRTETHRATDQRLLSVC